MAMTASNDLLALFESVRGLAEKANVFGAVRVRDGVLVCEAQEAAAPAEYRLFADAGAIWVGLFTADRWLSQSIEQDLVHTGDKLEELMEEELADQGEAAAGARPKFEHFRDEEKVFTFRTKVPVRPGENGAAERASRWLLACEAMFRRLGDMEGGDED